MISFKEFEQQGWEKVADAYHDGFGKITNQVALELVNKAMIKDKDKVLDIACGPGYVAALAFEKGGVPLGIDFSEAMIQKAKWLHPKIDFEVMDAEALKLKDRIFDVALMNFGILHLANPEQALKEVFRVLKPGGQFVFTVWDQPLRSKAFELIMSVIKEEGDLHISLPEGPDFFKFSDIDTSKEILSQIGFHKIESHQIEFIWALHSAEELFQTFYKGGVRVGEILRSQNSETVLRMIEKLKNKTSIFQKNGRLEIPVSVILLQAAKA